MLYQVIALLEYFELALQGCMHVPRRRANLLLLVYITCMFYIRLRGVSLTVLLKRHGWYCVEYHWCEELQAFSMLTLVF